MEHANKKPSRSRAKPTADRGSHATDVDGGSGGWIHAHDAALRGLAAVLPAEGFSVLRTSQLTSGRNSSHGMPVIASMSGQASAGMRSFFQREIDALDTFRPRADSSSASRDGPWTDEQARSSGVFCKVSMKVQAYDTPKLSIAKLPYCVKESLPYALLMGFATRLRQARKAKNMSGEELGRRLAVTKSTISHWERSVYEPNIEVIRAICDALDTTSDWLLERGDYAALSADALIEARAFEALSPEDRRKWRALRTTMFAAA